MESCSCVILSTRIVFPILLEVAFVFSGEIRQVDGQVVRAFLFNVVFLFEDMCLRFDSGREDVFVGAVIGIGPETEVIPFVKCH